MRLQSLAARASIALTGQEAADALRLMASAGDIILLKGSHSMQVDKMLELFK